MISIIVLCREGPGGPFISVTDGHLRGAFFRGGAGGTDQFMMTWMVLDPGGTILVVQGVVHDRSYGLDPWTIGGGGGGGERFVLTAPGWANFFWTRFRLRKPAGSEFIQTSLFIIYGICKG
jgi:hypothetical protein